MVFQHTEIGEAPPEPLDRRGIDGRIAFPLPQAPQASWQVCEPVPLRPRPESYSEGDPMETVRVIYHHEHDGWWAESPDIEGWSAAADSYPEVVKLTEQGIAFALQRAVALKDCTPVDERAPA